MENDSMRLFFGTVCGLCAVDFATSTANRRLAFHITTDAKFLTWTKSNEKSCRESVRTPTIFVKLR